MSISNFQISQSHFHMFKIRCFPIVSSKSFKLQLSNFRISKFQNSNNSKLNNKTVRYTYLPTFSEFQILRYENDMFQRCPHIFLYFLKRFGDKYGARGSRFGHVFGRSENVLKRIAIDHESLSSHLGIIKDH